MRLSVLVDEESTMRRLERNIYLKAIWVQLAIILILTVLIAIVEGFL